jgi:alkaline phosphatase
MRFNSFLFFLFSIFTFFSLSPVEAKSVKRVKNVILFIGDGMGPSQITGARIWRGGSQYSHYMESFPFVGFSKTYSSSDYVTDSAAGATALASGIKTRNRYIGVTDPAVDVTKKSRELETLCDIAKSLGKSVGVVTTTTVTHATPAAFYAHVQERDREEKIAMFLKSQPIDLLLGGGMKVFKKRVKNKKILNHLNSSWTVVSKKSELLNVSSLKKPVLGLFHSGHLPYESKKRDKSIPTLVEMTKVAINLLSQNKNGFFLVVEGGRIDHAAHQNKVDAAFQETVSLDNSVKLADQMTSKDTLIVVTADHETGGLSLNGYGSVNDVKSKELTNPDKQYVSWATGPLGAKDGKVKKSTKALHYGYASSHTAVDVPVFAKGPGAQLFSGVYSNHNIGLKISKILGKDFKSKANFNQAAR